MQRLRNLRSLTIPLSVLFGYDPPDKVVPQLADVLPSSLESLYLVGDFGGDGGWGRWWRGGGEVVERRWGGGEVVEGEPFHPLPTDDTPPAKRFEPRSAF